MKWFILIGVAIVGLGLYAYLNPPTNVTVTGTVTTTGIGTKPTFVDFTPNHGGSASSVAVTSGSYSAILLAKQVYNVKIHFSALGNITSSTCDAGTLNLQQVSSESQQHNIIC